MRQPARRRLDNHWRRILLAAGLATLLNLGFERGADSENDVARAIRKTAQNTIGRTGEKTARRQLAVPPALTDCCIAKFRRGVLAAAAASK